MEHAHGVFIGKAEPEQVFVIRVEAGYFAVDGAGGLFIFLHAGQPAADMEMGDKSEVGVFVIFQKKGAELIQVVLVSSKSMGRISFLKPQVIYKFY